LDVAVYSFFARPVAMVPLVFGDFACGDVCPLGTISLGVVFIIKGAVEREPVCKNRVTVHGEKRKKTAEEKRVPFTAYNKLTPTTSWWLRKKGGHRVDSTAPRISRAGRPAAVSHVNAPARKRANARMFLQMKEDLKTGNRVPRSCPEGNC